VSSEPKEPKEATDMKRKSVEPHATKPKKVTTSNEGSVEKYYLATVIEEQYLTPRATFNCCGTSKLGTVRSLLMMLLEIEIISLTDLQYRFSSRGAHANEDADDNDKNDSNDDAEYDEAEEEEKYQALQTAAVDEYMTYLSASNFSLCKLAVKIRACIHNVREDRHCPVYGLELTEISISDIPDALDHAGLL
jgi:hypothetical protein